LSFVPFVGAIPSGASAINDFSNGRILSGLGNTGIAAFSLLGGGSIAKGIGMAGRVAARGGNAARVAKTLSRMENIRRANNLNRVRKAKGAWQAARAYPTTWGRTWRSAVAPARVGFAYAGDPFRKVFTPMSNAAHAMMKQKVMAPLATRMSAPAMRRVTATGAALTSKHMRDAGLLSFAPFMATGGGDMAQNYAPEQFSAGYAQAPRYNSRPTYTPGYMPTRLPSAMSAPFDGGAGFFTPRQQPGMYRGLREFNPYINGNELPFGGTMSPGVL
jgi:hypothetical protein